MPRYSHPGRGAHGSSGRGSRLGPRSPSAELRPFGRIFTPLRRPSLGPPSTPHARAGADPWYPSFSGGTRISAGLAAAAAALRRDHVHGRILLISDLGDAPDDRANLRKELVALGQAGIELRVLALPNALYGDRRWFEKLEGRQSLVGSLPAQPSAPTRTARGFHVPLSLAIVAVLLALVLAANDRVGRSLRWGEAR